MNLGALRTLATAAEISASTGRPAFLGHLGAIIASQVFDITLEESAANKRVDRRNRRRHG